MVIFIIVQPFLIKFWKKGLNFVVFKSFGDNKNFKEGKLKNIWEIIVVPFKIV